MALGKATLYISFALFIFCIVGIMIQAILWVLILIRKRNVVKVISFGD